MMPGWELRDHHFSLPPLLRLREDEDFIYVCLGEAVLGTFSQGASPEVIQGAIDQLAASIWIGLSMAGLSTYSSPAFREALSNLTRREE